MTWSRRRFLTVVGVGVGGLAAGCTGDGDTASSTTSTSTTGPTTTLVPVGPYPFELGVASGDPDDTSVILWTWVERVGEVTVEIARDETFTDPVGPPSPVVVDDQSQTVRVLATGLDPDRAYWYRFTMDGHRTPPARTRTAPAPGALPAQPLRLAHLSCQRYSSGYWTALTDVADQAPDLVVHCGDYVYEADGGPIRPVDAPVPTDLDGYRALWRRYKTEPELQAAHAVAPWLVVWDDHEVENNYQGVHPNRAETSDAFLAQRAAAYRAWWEFTPSRVPEDADGADGGTTMYRTVDWGALTRFVLVDSRQYRDDQPCPDEFANDVGPRCDESDDVTMLGADQEAWFAEVATDHDAVWTTVVNQVVLHQWRFLGGNVLWNLDQWDGYPAARRRLLDVLAQAPTPVVLSGDVHSSWVADLRLDVDDPDSDLVGAEFVAPGISSAVPDDLRSGGPVIRSSSPHVAWSNLSKRGWVLHEIGADDWTATYRHVDDASVPDSGVTVATTWELQAGRPGLS